MGIGSGVAAQFAFAKESTKNTREVPDHFVEFVQESVQLQIARINRKGKRAGRRVNHGWAAGNQQVGGSVNFELVPESTGELLELCFGGLVTAGAGPYTHTLTPGDLASFTAQFGRPSSDGTVRPFDYIGCMINSWALSFDATGDGNMVDFQAEILGREEDTDQSLVAASYPAPTSWTSVQASLLLAGSAYCVDSATLTGNNNLLLRHQACAADAGKPKITESGMREYGGTLAADFADLTAYNRFKNGTEAALVVTIASGATSLVITENVRFDGTTPNVSDDSVLKQELPFVCTGTSDAAAITAVLTNSDSAA